MTHYILSIDQGTTSSRAVVFDQDSHLVSQHHIEITQYYPRDGWVAHDAEEIWQTTLTCCRQALKKANLSAQNVATIGISNQRETTVLWNRRTGQIVRRAIVWQDRRTAKICANLRTRTGIPEMIADKTGLLLDPYFSATKIKWLLDNVTGTRELAERGEIAFGTIDTFLLWKLTGGHVHATDVTNASRTMLFNIHTLKWDDELLALFDIPKSLLPEVYENCSKFGETTANLFGSPIPITGMIGDQQAATIGQACFQPGMVKSTYGTGAFLLLNTGEKVIRSKNKLLSTIAYQIDGKVTYGLEGSIFAAGSIIKWLRDQLKLIQSAHETERFAESIEDTGGVYLVPAFTGLGAPYWDSDARGALFGLTRDTCVEHIVRAALESICYQTLDLMQCMLQDGSGEFETLRVDGGMVTNNWLLQFLSDILSVEVSRPCITETTALGAAYIAGLGVGIYQSLEDISTLWKMDRDFRPQMGYQRRKHLYEGWETAVKRVLNSPQP